MKRTLFSLLVILVTTISVNAQKIEYALKGGVNINFVNVKANGRSYSGSGLGLHGGMVANIELAENISLQPGAILTYKNFKSKKLDDITVNQLSLDIPIVALYEKNHFFGGFGPTLNFGLVGGYRFSDDKYKLYDDKNSGLFSVKRVEIGLNFMAGYKWENDLFFSLSFAPSLTNIFNHAIYAGADTKVKTSILALSVGYPLNKIKAHK